ncbi:MAG TPA: DUF2207 domain-containing protein, partial [Candidatus Aminicenantes bacterium]|nr:DUF2207 domain-containing protein [Candidatus Aminicenantes bacterium]
MNIPTRPRRPLASALVAAAVLAAWTAGPGAVPARAKDYYFPEVRIEITVDRDGSFLVDERRTFEFQGRFSYAYIAIPLRLERQGVRRDVDISGLSVTDERGRAMRTEVVERSGVLTAKWFYTAQDEKRTFRIRYHVSGGITSYPDVTELYWQVIGDGWDRPARDIRATVILPAPVPSKDDLLVWGHGPLSGRAEIVDARTARFTAPELASRQFFEVRVVWPAGLVDGVASDRLTLDAIKAEERAFVDDTIARARQARAAEAGRREREAANKRTMRKVLTGWGIWQVLGPLLWLVLFGRAWSAVGKDYRFGGLPDYVREPPAERPPAVVQTLMREGGAVTPAAFTATIFDLARRGVLEIEDRSVLKKRLFGTKEAVETTITLKKDPAQTPGLVPFERSLLGFLYEEQAGGMTPGSSFTIDGLEATLKKHPRRFQAWYQKWTKAVKEETKPLGFLEPASLEARNRFYLFTLPAAVLTLSPVLLILALVLIPTLKRRTMAWARENEAWKGLDRFLDDFSDFEEIPPEAYKLWEHYLVYGILFGNAKKILKMLPVILQDERAAAPVW